MPGGLGRLFYPSGNQCKPELTGKMKGDKYDEPAVSSIASL